MARDSKKKSPDLNDPRLSSSILKTSLKKLSPAEGPQDIVIAQYPDDEGVRLNSGRPGAKYGPQKILKYLERMVFHFSETPRIFLLPPFNRSLPLHKKHTLAEHQAKKVFELGYRLITLGGGHDYGFPDASAYHEITNGKILNIDAHLDVRPVLNLKLNSGTAFFRFVERFGGENLIAWGIQKQCNALHHRQWAAQKGVQILSENESLPSLKGPIGLSVCLDAFEGIRGVSAPAMVGISTSQGLRTVRLLSPFSRWLGLYECAPQYDPLNEDSARFAALLAYHFIHSSELSR